MTLEDTANSSVRTAMDQGRQAADKASQAVKDGYDAAQQYVKDRGLELDQLSRMGADVYLVDYRGYADNPGNPTEADFASDAQAIWMLEEFPETASQRRADDALQRLCSAAESVLDWRSGVCPESAPTSFPERPTP